MNDATTPERNITFENFGGEATLIHDYRYWSLQVRPQQVTLGAMILLAHGPATRFGDLDAAAHGELATITSDIESRVGTLWGPQKYNYLMLMMVDPNVHFHVLPRYDGPQELGGIEFSDPGWPKLPDLTSAPQDERATEVVLKALKPVWR